jgi:DNA-binding GntR family transcriptional regulator
VPESEAPLGKDDTLWLPATPSDGDASGPKYARIKATLSRLIREGRIQPGTFLPSERELAERFNVSNITIKRALNDLAAEGVVQRKQGIGTFVVDTTAATRADAEAVLNESLVLHYSGQGQSPHH